MHWSGTELVIRRRTFLIGGAAAVGGAAAFAGKCLASVDGDSGPRLFGLSIPGSSLASVQDAQAAGASLGRAPQVINFYMAWEWQDPFPTATVAAIRDTGAVPEITWEPWDPHNGAPQAAYQLADLDRYDAYVDAFAKACAAYGDEVALRFGHEMNSDWYPWSVSTNGGSPDAYVAAYRRLHERFVAAGATNVRWVWCPNVIYKDQPDLISESYPGDDVVDIVGVDGYNRGGRSPEDLFAPTLDLLKGVGLHKPLWINEVGSIAMPDKARWITDLFDYLHSTAVNCVVWFEIDAAGTPDWRLLSTSETASAAREAIADW
jgi:mannan endo-1,4-beta-mannosidase